MADAQDSPGRDLPTCSCCYCGWFWGLYILGIKREEEERRLGRHSVLPGLRKLPPALPRLFWVSCGRQLWSPEEGGDRVAATTHPGSCGLVYDATWWQRLWASLFLTGGFLPLRRKSRRPVLALTAVVFRDT